MQARSVCPLDATKPELRFTFQAPCVVRLDLQTSKKKRSDGSFPMMIQLHFCIPVTPTRFRVNTYFLYISLHFLFTFLIFSVFVNCF
jgi:hypothetical protein